MHCIIKTPNFKWAFQNNMYATDHLLLAYNVKVASSSFRKTGCPSTTAACTS
jgi:hypothetical protein